MGAVEEHLGWTVHSLCVQDLLARVVPDPLSTSKGSHHSVAQMGRLRLEMGQDHCYCVGPGAELSLVALPSIQALTTSQA